MSEEMRIRRYTPHTEEECRNVAKRIIELQQENRKLKSVLDEIRRKIDYYIFHSTSDSAYESYQQYKELLQILDKVKK